MFIKSLFRGALFIALAFSQERDLNRGRGELRGFAGVRFGSNSGSMDSVAPTEGTEVAFGITRVLAVTGSYPVPPTGCTSGSIGLAPPASGNPQLFEAGFHLGQTALFTCIDRRKVITSMLDANDQDNFARPAAFRMKPVVEWLHFIG